jgi:hypothetical protein
VADLIRRELRVQTELIEGDRGEFSVWVDNKVVAKKGWLRFPSDEKVLKAVRQAIMV